ncbi:hypothetical protein D3C81_1988930 [compost metagenome]
MGDLGHFLHRIYHAEHVGYISGGDDFRLVGDRLLHILQRNAAVRLQRDEFQGRPGPFGKLLPRNEVTMVLHLGNYDLIPRR